MTPPTHDVLRDSAALYALDALDGEELRTFETHLATCEACRADVDSYREASAALAFAVAPAPPPADDAIRQRLLRRARDDRDNRRSEPAAASPTAAADAVRPITSARAWRTRLGVAGWLAAAASLTIAVGSQIAYRRERDARALVATELAAAREALALRDSTLAAFIGPEVHVVSLSEPASKPKVRVFWNHTRSAFIITADGLPTPAPGKTYQLWALRKGKPPMSMGTFTTDARGRAATVVAVAEDITNGGFIDDCALTLEPEGGSPAPTETPRLVGTWRHVD